jgi:hypothetical protein
MWFLRQGEIVGLKDGRRGVIEAVEGYKVLVKFGERGGSAWVDKFDIDPRLTVILRTAYALRKVSEVEDFAQVKEKKVVLPTVPTSPLIERLPPKPPGFPEELKEMLPKQIDVTKLDAVSRKVASLLTKIKELASKRAELEEQISDLNSKIKPIRDASKEIQIEIYRAAEELIKEVERDLAGSKELKTYIAMWQEKVLYIVRWLSQVKDEPTDAEKLEMLWALLEKELTPRKLDEIKAKFEKAILEATEVSAELDTYLAVLPLASFRVGGGAKRVAQEGLWEKVKDFVRRFYDFVKRGVRKLLGIRSVIDAIRQDLKNAIDLLIDIGF